MYTTLAITIVALAVLSGAIYLARRNRPIAAVENQAPAWQPRHYTEEELESMKRAAMAEQRQYFQNRFRPLPQRGPRPHFA